MIGLSRALCVFAFTEPCDMRKSFHTLSALVEQQMKRSVLTGDMFLFVSRDRTRAKVLYFDGIGLCVLNLPGFDGESQRGQDGSGSSFDGKKRKKKVY